MKELKYKTVKSITLLFVLLFAYTLSVHAENEEFTRVVKQEWDATELTKLLIENKFGDVVIKNMPQNKITIEVTISVEASNLEKAEKIMDKIKISFSEDGDLKKAITTIEENLNTDKLKIDWLVNVPVYLNMDLTNRYGSIDIDENHGKTNITVKYGKLIADKLLFDDSKPLNIISVSYGKVFINTITRAKIQSSYSDCNIGESAAIIINSQYSEIKIESVKALVAESKYDEYEIKSANSAVYIGKFGAIEIEKLSKKLDIDVKYTNCVVNAVNPDFTDIKVNFSYGNVEIGMPDEASYRLNANGKYGNIDYPDGNNMQVINETTEWHVQGIVGKDTEPKASVTVNGKYGNIDLDN